MSFPQFPLLPAEIRIQIWKLAIPKHQLVEVRWNNEIKPAPVPSNTEKDAITGEGQKLVTPPPQLPQCDYIRIPKMPLPALLHVCRESRAVGLEYFEPTLDMDWERNRPKAERRNGVFSKYVPATDTRWKTWYTDFHSVSRMYCNLQSDALFLKNDTYGCESAFLCVSHSHLVPVFREPALRKVRYLVLEHKTRYERWLSHEKRGYCHKWARMRHDGRDLRGLRGLTELRELIIAVPKRRGWDLDAVREVFESELEWAYGRRPEMERPPDLLEKIHEGSDAPMMPKVRIFVDCMNCMKRKIESGEIVLGDE